MPEGVETQNRLIVLYDGLCGMCDGVVQFLLRHDKKDAFRYAAQQSEVAQRILARHAPDPPDMETICVIESYDSPRERVLVRSDAVLRIASTLGGVWGLARVTGLLPRFVRDAAMMSLPATDFGSVGDEWHADSQLSGTSTNFSIQLPRRHEVGVS